jgi:signal transduction histidine kinase
MRPREMSVRVRLTAAYALLFCATVGLLLGASYWLLDRHFHRTLSDGAAGDALRAVGLQYLLAFGGTVLLALAAGWIIAGRALAPIGRMTAFARRVSGERLDERIALEGPADELRELADTLDAMLDGLSESFGAQRRFVANAGHELRGPLTVIRTQAEVALADPDASPGELRAMGEAVVDACRRAEALLEGLMALARSQRALVAREPADLAPGARAAVAAVAAEARAADVRVRLDARSAPTLGDRRLLDRLVVNLVENAVRHNTPGGTVEVATSTRGDRAAVRVTNTGHLLLDESVARLTEPFERLGRPADARGAGLGLSIVQSVAEAHRGEVHLVARDGGGLEAEVLLPLAAGDGPAQ